MHVLVRADVYQRYYKALRNCFWPIVQSTIRKQARILNVVAEGAMKIS